MTIHQFEIIIYVKDQKRSKDFYSSVLQKEPVLDVPGMTEFLLADNLKLGLMRKVELQKYYPIKLRTLHPGMVFRDVNYTYTLTILMKYLI